MLRKDNIIILETKPHFKAVGLLRMLHSVVVDQIVNILEMEMIKSFVCFLPKVKHCNNSLVSCPNPQIQCWFYNKTL